jgi:hypothetical protein
MVDRVYPVHAPGQHIPTGFIPAIIFTRCLRQRTDAENEDCRKSKRSLSKHGAYLLDVAHGYEIDGEAAGTIKF